MISERTKARWLALSIRSGRWSRAAIVDRLERALPIWFRDIRQLGARLWFHFEGESSPPVDALIQFILAEPLLVEVLESDAIRAPLLDSPQMVETPEPLVTLPLPELATWSATAAWLELADGELAWFADCRSLQAKSRERALHHYRYSWVPKRDGSLRLIEAPKPRLKFIQRKILGEILNRVPPHDAAHGFCRGRSTKSHAERHVGQAVLLRMDLKDFFHSVPVARIGALFRRLGYPANVAWLLQGLCTHAASPTLAGGEFARLDWARRKRLTSKHLAQGAPTSAPLANLCAYRLDCRLQGLARRYGLRYSRYADDLAFSGAGDLAGLSGFLESLVGAIALDEGFCLNHKKTRLRLRSQRQKLAGVVVNDRLNYPRQEWDQLKAVLHNCKKYGPASQNRDGRRNFKAHLQGRVAHVAWLNPSRGKKLRRLWQAIDWQA